MIDVSYVSALIGGILTFLAPCTLPLIPAFIAFISGSAKLNQNDIFSHSRLFQNAIMFVLGFSVVFIIFGIASGTIGKMLFLHKAILSQVGGIIIMLMGFSMLGVLSSVSFRSIFRIPIFTIPKFIVPGSRFGGFALGFVFAIGWSPCLGPILGAIILLAATSGTALSGGLLLATYSLGLAIPFLLVAYLYGKTFTYVIALQKYLPIISKIGAIMIIAIGFLLVIGQYGILNFWGAQLLRGLGLERFMQFM